MSNLPRFTDTDLEAGLRHMAPGGATKVQDLARKFVDAVLRRTAIVRFSPLPGVVQGALEATRGPWDAGGVSGWFALDPVLAARLLGASAGTPGESGDSRIDLATRVRTLGPGLSRALLMSAGAGALRSSPEAPRVVDVAAFWAHAVRAACVAEALAASAAYGDPEGAYLAGLLHDIGMLALADALPGTCDGLLRVDPSADPGEARERAGRFGTIHAEIGAALLEDLRAPAAICDAVLLHHAPVEDLKGTHAMVRILRSTEAICQRGAAENGARVAMELLGLSRTAVQRALDDADRATARATGRVRAVSAGAPDTAGTEGAAAPTPDAGLSAYLLTATACAEAAVKLGDATTLATALDHLGRLLPAIAGVGSCVVFAAETPGDAPAGWRVASSVVARLDIDLARADPCGVVAHAFREGCRALSHEPPRGTRVVGIDWQVMRALHAGTIAALPLRSAEGGCAGVLVVGFPLGAITTAAETLPAVQGIADAFGAALERLRARPEDGQGAGGAREALRAATQHLVHEARNPLSIIKASVEVARRRAVHGEDISGELDVFAEEIDRVCEIVNQIANVEPVGDGKSGVVDVNRAIRELLVLYEGPLFRSRGLAVELDLAAGDPAVVGNARKFKQVLLNLLKNASEAMELGGEVEIATADLVNVEGRMMVEIKVADSGPGLSAGAMSKLFEAGAEGRRESGRGLGLANSLRFVRDMGGHLSCRSRPGEGATFAVLLPRVADARVARYRRTRQLGA